MMYQTIYILALMTGSMPEPVNVYHSMDKCMKAADYYTSEEVGDVAFGCAKYDIEKNTTKWSGVR